MDKILRGKFSLACTGCSLLLLGSLGTEGDKMLILNFSELGRLFNFRKNLGISRSHQVLHSFYRRRCPKTGLKTKTGQKTISFGQKTFQIHYGKSEEWVAMEKTRILNLSSVKLHLLSHEKY